jgi:cell division septal protein FtsQ
MIVVGTAGALGLGAPFWAPPVLGTLPVFRVERVEVAGNVFVQHDDVLQLAAIAPEASVWDDGSVWEARVRSHALVREARVRRVGMRGIEIRVTEAQPLALVMEQTLVPVDEEGRKLPLDPSVWGLNLPVLTGGVEVEDGEVRDDWGRGALRALAALKEYDDAFFGQISELGPLDAESLEIELIESGRTGRVLLLAADAVREWSWR